MSEAVIIKNKIMKTIAAENVSGKLSLPVDVKQVYPRRHFYIHLPGIPLKKVETTENNRFLWMAVVMLVQSILITPAVAATILFTGNWMPLWFVATASMYAAFIPCLSAQNVQWIKTVFFYSCLLSGLTIVAAILHSLIV